MKSLNSFLHPKRKENMKFILSDAFLDENGKPIEWELRQLSAKEGIELQKKMEGRDYMAVMTAYVANALVYPDLRDKELLDALSEQEGRPVLSPMEALPLLTTDAELATLIQKYSAHNDLTTSFADKVEEAKN